MRRVCTGCPLAIRCLVGKVSYFFLTYCPQCKNIAFDISHRDPTPFCADMHSQIVSTYSVDNFNHSFEECKKHRGTRKFICFPCAVRHTTQEMNTNMGRAINGVSDAG